MDWLWVVAGSGWLLAFAALASARRVARRLAQLAFLRNRDVAVALGPLDITLQGGEDPTHATVRFTAAPKDADSLAGTIAGPMGEMTFVGRRKA